MLWLFRNKTIEIHLSVGNVLGLFLVALECVPVVPSTQGQAAEGVAWFKAMAFK